MTDNITKLYEIAGAQKCGCKDKVIGESCTYGSEKWEKCNAEGMACPKEIWETAEPPFTAEKQLELIKKVLEKGLLQLNRSSLGNIQFCNFGNAGDYKAEFDEALASFIINLWQDLSDNQKQEIKRILQ